MQHIKSDCCFHVLVMATYQKKKEKEKRKSKSKREKREREKEKKKKLRKRKKKKEKRDQPVRKEKRNISKQKCTTWESWISL